jgi:hypothetical protein
VTQQRTIDAHHTAPGKIACTRTILLAGRAGDRRGRTSARRLRRRSRRGWGPSKGGSRPSAALARFATPKLFGSCGLSLNREHSVGMQSILSIIRVLTTLHRVLLALCGHAAHAFDHWIREFAQCAYHSLPVFRTTGIAFRPSDHCACVQSYVSVQ